MNTTARLVARARKGDREAFDELMRTHYDTVRRSALRFAAISDDADDLVQETFVTAYEHLGQLKQPELFSAWLAAIARSEGLMWSRRRLNQPRLLSLDGDEPGAGCAVGTLLTEAARETARRQSVRESISEALSSLTVDQRLAVRLHYLHGYNYGETAALLDIPVAAVRGRLERARNTLRKELRRMTAQSTDEYNLSSHDLDALRAAADCAEYRPSPHPRPQLEAVFFTGSGRLVSTDTHRLFCYTSPSLDRIPRALIHADMARALRDEHGDACGGRLTLTKKQASLALDSGATISAPLVKGQFPDWERIIPADWRLKVEAPVGEWLEALEMLVGQGPEEPKVPENRILLTFSCEEGRIIIRKGKEPAELQRVSWESSVSFPADVQETLNCAFNITYLEQAMRALRLPPDGAVAICLNAPEKAALVRPTDSERLWTLVMPMQIVTHQPSVEPSAD